MNTISDQTGCYRQTRFHSSRGIVKGLSYSALVIVCLITSPALSEAQWKQSKFVLGTWVDPPIVQSANDTATLLTARAAYFNLLTGLTEGALSFQDMHYRLDIADKVNFKSFISDERFTDRVFSCFYWGANCPPFDQSDATAVTDNYKGLDLRRRRAIYGYRIADEPCDSHYCFWLTDNFGNPFPRHLVPDPVKEWVAHFKIEDPSKLAWVNLSGNLVPVGAPKGDYEAHLDTFVSDANRQENLDGFV